MQSWNIAYYNHFNMNSFIKYLNPVSHLGKKEYSVLFPLIFSITIPILSEIFAYQIANNPNIVGVYIIFIDVAAIIYFAFLRGIRGGAVAAIFPILYYLYIIYTRQYRDTQLTSAIETTIILAVLYLFLAVIIGWLKQTIDNLIEKEADGRRRLEAIIEQLPVGVIISDRNGKITHTNKQLETILGTKIPLGFVLGKDSNPLLSTHNGKPTTATQSPLYQSLNSGKPIVRKEFSLQRPDGKKIYVQVNASPIASHNKRIIAGASIIHDITPLREMELRKDDFINMASHELKTPITSMKLYIDSLLTKVKGYGDERALRSLNSLKYQTNKLQELVSDLLDVSRIQTGKLSFNREVFNITELIEETVDQLKESSRHHKLVFKSKTPIKAYADRFRIYQVLTNLLTNAIKYSPDGGEIEINLKRLKSTIEVSIKDSGIGISKEQQSKIFDRLYQVTDPKEKTFPGLGMGLYISKEIIKRHQGKIWLESQKDRGSTFFFSLPTGNLK